MWVRVGGCTHVFRTHVPQLHVRRSGQPRRHDDIAIFRHLRLRACARDSPTWHWRSLLGWTLSAAQTGGRARCAGHARHAITDHLRAATRPITASLRPGSRARGRMFIHQHGARRPTRPNLSVRCQFVNCQFANWQCMNWQLKVEPKINMQTDRRRGPCTCIDTQLLP